ncbi:PQ-loop domain-containing transporter [Tumebacillus lipolyticus]|uniref:PQ-loop domain-containing transporter n=1 Tax=Tumebacillus lipolyticus TaxID=1280370 RepID=A0ABW4ZVL3_9BACL
MFFAVLQLIGGVILSFGWIPQIVQIVKTKSVKDLNKKTFWLLLAGISLMEVYAVSLAVDGVGYAFLITNSMSLILILIIIGLMFKYKKS